MYLQVELAARGDAPTSRRHPVGARFVTLRQHGRMRWPTELPTHMRHSRSSDMVLCRSWQSWAVVQKLLASAAEALAQGRSNAKITTRLEFDSRGGRKRPNSPSCAARSRHHGGGSDGCGRGGSFNQRSRGALNRGALEPPTGRCDAAVWASVALRKGSGPH